MKHPLLTLALAGSLVFTSLAETRPRQRPVPPASPYLSATERLCEAFGLFAFARTNDRDGGMPLVRMLALSRQYDAQHGAAPWIRAIHDTIIRGVYASMGMD